MATLQNLTISLHRLTGATNIAATLRHHARNATQPPQLLKIIWLCRPPGSVTGLSPAGFWSRRELRAARVQLQLAHTVALRLAPHAALIFRWPALRTLLLGSIFARPWRVPPAKAAHALVAYARCPGWQPTFTAAISDPAGDPGGELGVPVTLLWGRRDLLLPPRQRLRARDRLPAAQIGLLPGCGPVPMWDNPQLVAHVLLIGST